MTECRSVVNGEFKVEASFHGDVKKIVLLREA